jgi:Do/DeqQ family serine protease
MFHRPAVLALFCLSLAPAILPLAARAEATVPGSASEITLSFAPVVKATAPAVVSIYTSRVVQEQINAFGNDPFFSPFFQGSGPSTPRVQNALGSGVIVSPDGYIVSNYHVVGQASEIRVVLNDRREFDARLVLGDQESDLAVLKLDGVKDLPTLSFRESDSVEVGDLVLAIGNPFGVGQTVSQGIVSGLARSTVGQGRGYFIQTDAAINPGNSGGALVDVQGRLVGINSAILTKSGGSNGIGFAIPAKLVETVVHQAEAGRARFARPWAGVAGQAVDAAMAEAMGLPHPDGVVLSDIHPDSPFAKAGLVAGDVVLSVANEATNTPQEMIFRLAALGIGATVPVTYRHEDATQSVTITLIAPPENPARDALTLGGDLALSGLSVSNINPAVEAELGLSLGAQGVVVTAADQMAARLGLQPGDLLLSINGVNMTSPKDVEKAAKQETRRWAIDLVRDGQTLRLRFRL